MFLFNKHKKAIEFLKIHVILFLKEFFLFKKTAIISMRGDFNAY